MTKFFALIAKYWWGWDDGDVVTEMELDEMRRGFGVLHGWNPHRGSQGHPPPSWHKSSPLPRWVRVISKYHYEKLPCFGVHWTLGALMQGHIFVCRTDFPSSHLSIWFSCVWTFLYENSIMLTTRHVCWKPSNHACSLSVMPVQCSSRRSNQHNFTPLCIHFAHSGEKHLRNELNSWWVLSFQCWLQAS